MRRLALLILMVFPLAGFSSRPPPAALHRAEALAKIAAAQAEAGDVPGAMGTLAIALDMAEAVEKASDHAEALSHIAWAQAKADDTAGALDTAQRIENIHSRSVALNRVAVARVEADDDAGARRAAGLAMAAVKGVANADTESVLWTVPVAWAQARAGDVASAIEMARGFGGKQEAVQALTMLAVAAAQAETDDKAGARDTIALALDAMGPDLEAVKTETDDEGRDDMLIVLAWIQTKAGDVAGGLDSAERIPDLSRRALALGLCAAIQAESGDAKGARETAARALVALERRPWLGIHVVAVTNKVEEQYGLELGKGTIVVSVKAGSPAEDANIELGDVILSVAGRETNDRSSLGEIVAQRSAGDMVTLRVRRDDAEFDVQVPLETPPPDLDVNWSLATMAQSAAAIARAGAGDLAGAFDTVTSIARPDGRALAASSLASARAAVGDEASARRAAAFALDAAGRVVDGESRAIALSGVAWAQAEAGDVAGALATVSAIGESYDDDEETYPATMLGKFLAGDTAGALGDALDLLARFDLFRKDRPRAPVAIAVLQAKTGDVAAALDTVLTIADSEDERDAGLRRSSQRQAKAGKLAGALRTAGLIRTATRRSGAFADVAQLRAEAGDPEGAGRAFALALEAAHTVERANLRAVTFVEIAKARVRVGDIEGAQLTFALAVEAAHAVEIADLRAEVLAWIDRERARLDKAPAE